MAQLFSVCFNTVHRGKCAFCRVNDDQCKDHNDLNGVRQEKKLPYPDARLHSFPISLVIT